MLSFHILLLVCSMFNCFFGEQNFVNVQDHPQTESKPFDFLNGIFYRQAGSSVIKDEYDFIIIGAGSAGSVLASRLSEERSWSVLVLEAGGGESFLSEVPFLAAELQQTDYNWGYVTEKQNEACLGMEGQMCGWPRGKALGGSSAINYMIYTRGHKTDWDKIAAQGNPGWSYDDVLPYFYKSERANLQNLINSPYHNKNGKMSIEDVSYRTPLARAFLDAGRELGNEILDDYNIGDQLGFAYVQAHTSRGRRHSAARAFLDPAYGRPNLHISTFSTATKINIDPVTRVAESVEYVRNGIAYTVRAKREIISSAGVLASPKILMLSGIGPKEHLEDMGIDVIENLQVGENLYDHLFFVGLPFYINQTILDSNVTSFESISDWLITGRGPLSMIGGVEALAYIKTNLSERNFERYPDIELVFVVGGISDTSDALRKGIRISESFFNQTYYDVIGNASWTIFPTLLHPKSKGYLRLRSGDPFQHPEIYHNYFTERSDLDTMVEGIKYIIELSKTEAFRAFDSKILNRSFPTCNMYEFGSDDYWACAARALATSAHHQIGTCKMGPPNDPGAVVDNQLRVYGIQNLRIADTSVIPIPITAHTNAPAIMIGEKLADLIKNIH